MTTESGFRCESKIPEGRCGVPVGDSEQAPVEIYLSGCGQRVPASRKDSGRKAIFNGRIFPGKPRCKCHVTPIIVRQGMGLLNRGKSLAAKLSARGGTAQWGRC